MGQAVHVMVFAESEDAGLEACATALAELRRVESRLSLFDDASDVCELNRRAGRRAMRMDRDLRAVLTAAEEFRKHTRGAFNGAVEPLMRTWGFHRPRASSPTSAEIAEAREAVHAAIVRLDGDTALLLGAHTQLDFGGIGVGYGIDRMIAVLQKAGIRRAFVDVSGDMYGLGTPLGEPRGWRVDIAGTTRSAYLRNRALSTSSNLVSIVRLGRRIFGHIMDPETGWPVDSTQQMTVMAQTAIAADALSTAALVEGHVPANV
jgi:thiamine biosynthesis lipoprotein